MSEATFSKRLRDNCKEFGVRTIRIESPTTPGLPDIHYQFLTNGILPSSSGWIETKNEENLPKKIAYRPNQPEWLESYVNNGGKAFTLIYISSLKKVIWVDGMYSKLAGQNLLLANCSIPFDVSDKYGWRRLVEAIASR